MLSIFFLIFLSASGFRNRNNKHVFTCNHDREIQSQLRNSPPHKLIDSSKFITEDVDKSELEKEVRNRQPIRVRMDLRAIDDPRIDKFSCKNVGDQEKPEEYACRQEDILDDKKKEVIKVTIQNAEKYITQLVNVTRATEPLDPGGVLSTVGWDDQKPDFSNIDLFIFVLERAYGETSDTLASASPLRSVSSSSSNFLDRGRPYIGQIRINAAKLPSKPQNYNDGDRQFFVTCMHELMHILAFSSGLFGSWVNRSSGSIYNQNISNFKFNNNYGVEQSFIATPKLTEWVHDRFQVVNPELLRFGLELEDGGGKGTAGSHPNSRLYFTDIMQGKTYGPGYFSPIFFHSLYDSGWYEPNYDMMEQLIYLDPRYVDEPISQYVLTEPPRDSFPKEIFCSNNRQAYCYYDYSYKAICDSYSLKEIVDLGYIKKQIANASNFQTWYGGPGNKFSDEENFDYMPVLFPSGDSNCRNENAPSESKQVADMAKRMEETYSTSSVCLLTTIWKQSLTQFSIQKNSGCYKARCGEDGKLRVTLPKTKEQVCFRENQRIYKKGSTKYALCPKVGAACANFPNKSTMVSIESALPDRGPSNGENYILLQGINLLKHPILSVTFGILSDKTGRYVTDKDYTKIISIKSDNFIEYTNDRILIKMPKNPQVGKKQIGVSVDLIFETRDTIDVNFVEDIYTFLKRDYNNP